MNKRRAATLAPADGALADVRLLFEPSERERAERHLQRAKALLSAAAHAVLAGDADAGELGDRALAEMKTAQLEIDRIDAQEQPR